MSAARVRLEGWVESEERWHPMPFSWPSRAAAQADFEQFQARNPDRKFRLVEAAEAQP